MPHSKKLGCVVTPELGTTPTGRSGGDAGSQATLESPMRVTTMLALSATLLTAACEQPVEPIPEDGVEQWVEDAFIDEEAPSSADVPREAEPSWLHVSVIDDADGRVTDEYVLWTTRPNHCDALQVALPRIHDGFHMLYESSEILDEDVASGALREDDHALQHCQDVAVPYHELLRDLDQLWFGQPGDQTLRLEPEIRGAPASWKEATLWATKRTSSAPGLT